MRGRYGSPGRGLYQFSSWHNQYQFDIKQIWQNITTITLYRGRGRSSKLKLFDVKALFPSPSVSLRGPAIINSSPGGAKAIIVDDILTPPHWSEAWIPWKLAYTDGEVLIQLMFLLCCSFYINIFHIETYSAELPDTLVVTGDIFLCLIEVRIIKVWSRACIVAYWEINICGSVWSFRHYTFSVWGCGSWIW